MDLVGTGTGRIQLFWALVALAAGLIIAVLRDAMLPFAAAFFLAYALDPVVTRFEKFGLSRAMATTLVTGVLALVIVAVFLVVIPFLIDQSLAFAARAPAIAERLRLMLVQSVLADRLHRWAQSLMILQQPGSRFQNPSRNCWKF
jgi:predicted PurR-regulated permease PerM